MIKYKHSLLVGVSSINRGVGNPFVSGEAGDPSDSLEPEISAALYGRVQRKGEGSAPSGTESGVKPLFVWTRNNLGLLFHALVGVHHTVVGGHHSCVYWL